jgi:pimeloyl-ACP methyl ester carboxylesterase
MQFARASQAALAAPLLAATLILSGANGEAQPQWLSLPPTPSLPAQSSGGHLDRGDAVLWYATFGDETKPAVLLLHGGGGSSDYWAHLIHDLQRDHRVIVFDCRGQGRSTHEGAALSYAQMADDAVALLDHLRVSQTAVVGWSDGANIGFYLALKYPGRINALMAFAGNATPTGYQPSTNSAIMAAYARRTNMEYRSLSPHPERRDAVTRLLGQMWKTQPTLTKKQFAGIKARTLLLHAEHDEIIRLSHSREIAGNIPNADFVLLRGVSHFALLQDPESFNQAVRAFLARP